MFVERLLLCCGANLDHQHNRRMTTEPLRARVVKLQRVHQTCQGCRLYTSLSTPCHHPSTLYAASHTHGASVCSARRCVARPQHPSHSMPHQLKRTSHQKQNGFCMSMLPASRTTAPGGVRACCHTVCLSAAHSSNFGRKCWLHNLSHSHKPCPLQQAAKATGMHACTTHTQWGQIHTHPTANQDADNTNNQQRPTTESTQHKLGRHGQTSCLDWPVGRCLHCAPCCIPCCACATAQA